MFLFSGVWVGVTEHYHIYLNFSNKKILVAIQHQIKSKYSTSENYKWQGKFYNARLFFCCNLFCFLFCCCCFSFIFIFFWGVGRGLGLGLFCFVFYGGARIQRNATLMQSIALRSAIVGREIWSQVVCLFCFFVCLFFWFLFYFYYFFGGGGWLSFFWGWWTGYRLSQLCSEHCITENFSAISFSVCFAFCCGLVCLVCLFFKPLQYFGAPE